MKRLRSSEDLASYGDKGGGKDWGRRDDDSAMHRSSSHRNFYYKPDSGRKGVSSSSSSRYDRVDDDREGTVAPRKCSDYDADGYDRRKSYDRYRDGNDRVVMSSSSPRTGYGGNRIHRSESFSVPRRDFPKGFRSERDKSRREGSVSAFRRIGGGKDSDDGARSGSESLKTSNTVLADASKGKSPLHLRDPKSPARSKDSGSEQSKSAECKKTDDLPLKSEPSKSVEWRKNGSTARSSEMEEGELEPDPHPVSVTDPLNQELHSVIVECQAGTKLVEDGESALNKEDTENKKEQEKGGPAEKDQDGRKEVNEFPNYTTPSTQANVHSRKETVSPANSVEGKDNEHSREVSNCRQRTDDMITDKASNGTISAEVSASGAECADVAAKTNDIALTITAEESVEKCAALGSISGPAVEERTETLEDKGTSVAISTSSTPALTDAVKTEHRGITYQDAYIEGPSGRGFELFTSNPVKKTENVEHLTCGENNESLALDLSLSLPNVLLPIGLNNQVQPPGSPSRVKSSQSFRSTFLTNSDGFTTSFSGSQNFTHNPSCSLTHDSFDNYEQSVKSRPIFQGVDWQALASNENKTKEVSFFPKSISNENGLYQKSQVPERTAQSHDVLQQLRVIEGNSKMPIQMERQLSLNKHLSGAQSWHSNDVRSPSISAGSHETRSEYTKDKTRHFKEKRGGSSCRINILDGKDLISSGADFAESIIPMIVSEPLHLMARRFSEMTEQQVALVKESVRGIVLTPGKQWQLSALQKALRSRTDITLKMLLKSHRVQLEILISLKTGLQEFLKQRVEISSSDLAEIFLNLRCRNLSCRSLLPVDECDCEVCVQKNGFCSACMCLLCYKFDMASNTCSWVGCDMCLHWCHADCGLQKSYIRNGPSVSRSEGLEMQFHCVACNHPSEMFGFVKEVFQNCAKDWTSEALSKELEYVGRIFAASEDLRGRRLHEIAVEMLDRLRNKADLHEVQRWIMDFLADAESNRSGNSPPINRQDFSVGDDGKSNGVVGSSRGTEWLNIMRAEKAPQAEKSASSFPSSDYNQNENNVMKQDMQINRRSEPVFDELESIVRIKHAEAKMFQGRAEEARREAEALKHIAQKKKERIEEEYRNRIAKLRLIEAEDIRKRKLEELQGVERGYQEYLSMKMRMEIDIKDLLLKMEATRRNLTV